VEDLEKQSDSPSERLLSWIDILPPSTHFIIFRPGLAIVKREPITASDRCTVFERVLLNPGVANLNYQLSELRIEEAMSVDPRMILIKSSSLCGLSKDVNVP